MANPALIDELERQFRDNPRRVFARLANEYRKAGDYMRAIEICHAHVPQQPGYISGHIVLGQALYDAGEMDQAHETFQAALALDPENLIALRQLGDIARNRRDYREARSWYTRLLDVDPQNEEIVAQLGELALSDHGGASRNGGDAHLDHGPQPEDTAPAVPEPADTMEYGAAVEAADDRDAREAPDAAMPEEPELARQAEREGFESELDDDAALLDFEMRESPPASVEEEAPAIDAPAPEPLLEATVVEDDVAWLSVSNDAAGDDALIIEEVIETETTETIIASDPRDAEGPMDSDLDFTFEAEEYDTPLRPHTGESLSVIAEEDALAGVQPVHRGEPSPFGEPFDDGDGSDSASTEAEARFEPLPIEELDAASSESPAELGGLERLDDAMSSWASAPPPAGSADSPGEPATSDVLDLSEAETLIEESALELAWSEQAGDDDAPPSAASPSETLDDEFGWFDDEFAPPRAPQPEAHPEARPSEPWDAAEPDASRQDEPEAVAAVADASGGDVPGEEEASVAVEADGPHLTSAGAEEPSAAAEPATDDVAPTSADAEPPGIHAEPTTSYAASAGFDAQRMSADAEPVDEDAYLKTPDSLLATAESASPEAEPPRLREPDRTAAAFVTETMAELYLRQGFRNEALEVYRKLAAQAPGDQVIQARLAELEAGSDLVGVESGGGAEEPGKPSLDRPAASFFRSLASVRVTARATPPSGAESASDDHSASGSSDQYAAPAPGAASQVEDGGGEQAEEAGTAHWANDALAEFGEVRDEDESAARALAQGFAPEPPPAPAPRSATRAAAQEMSLNDIFGRPERAQQRAGTPGAMEAFFTPEGERAGEANEEEGREDLEAFNAWLEGLKK
jgi:tetratricopeptide (TPR) repeat protein